MDAQLSNAVRGGDYQEVERTLRMDGIDVNATFGRFNRTSLQQACFFGHVKTVRVLLDAGADVDAIDNNGWRALHIAAQNGHLEVVQVLLDAGADVHATNNRGLTALHTASQNGHLEVVQVLLDTGADVDATIQ